jgi:KaiC/GvpD/RAD55 family RecA-like ATPase
MLKDIDAKIICAENGQIAIEKAIKHQPDLVITDVIMPQKNGFEVCSAIRNTPKISQIPIIILSALGDEYNKITGFEEGANEYLIKPFNAEHLKERVKALLFRSNTELAELTASSHTNLAGPDSAPVIPTGYAALDRNLNGGIPRGSNILIVGPLGVGKSSFSRHFLCDGLKQNEKSMFIALDDAPNRIRAALNTHLASTTLSDHASKNEFALVDAYSWLSLTDDQTETFSVTGALELNQLAGIISDAGFTIDQTVQKKKGGRRVIDSISSLLVNFELSQVQRFLSQIARTATAFGDVTSLFIIEAGTVDQQTLNNIKYIMDGVIEFSHNNNTRQVRAASMKWMPIITNWTTIP